MSLTQEQIRFGYLMILGREPESAAAYRAHAHYPDLATLRSRLLGSPEGQLAVRNVLADMGHPADHYARPAICHLHIEKTGGTALQRMLVAQFSPERVSPVHLTNLHGMTLSELGRYDLVSGHFDYLSSMLLPRRQVRRVALFRDPVERLVSFYRFHRAHPAESGSTLAFVDLARRLEPEAFFRHPALAASPRTNNGYVRIMGTSLSAPIGAPAEDEVLCRSVLDLASERLLGIEGLGLTERSGDCAPLVVEALGLPGDPTITATHRTDDFAVTRPGFARVEDVAITRALREAAAPLTRFDQILYDLARREVDRRLADRTAGQRPALGRLLTRFRQAAGAR